MSTQPFYRFAEEVSEERHITIDEFCEQLGIRPRTYYDWKKKDREVRIPIDWIYRLAEISGRTRQEVLRYFGFPTFFDEERPQPKISPFPLVSSLPNHPEVHRAVRLATQGRNSYGLYGDLNEARYLYEEAYELARKGNEPLLATYIQLILGNTYRMLGNVFDAERYIVRAQENAQDLAQQYDKPDASRKQHVATMLVGRAATLLATLDWSIGDLLTVKESAENALTQLELNDDYAFIPTVYYVLGRTYADLNQPERAFIYAKRGLDAALRLELPHFGSHALFLDFPSEYGHLWRVDQLLQLKTDVLIATGQLEEAEKTYLSIAIPKSPATTLSLHNWFSPDWQQYVAQRRHEWQERAIDDLNIEAGFETWRDEIILSGNPHMLAIVQTQYARTLREQKQTDEAVSLLSEALISAQKAQAQFTTVTTGLELATTYLERQGAGDTDAALVVLSAVQEAVQRLRIPMLDERLSLTHDRVASNT